MSIPQHSSNSENYITPKFISDAYKEVLGTDIALDPATSHVGNSLYVKATNIYTEADNGLEMPWKAANVFLNFPSSKTLNSEYRKKYGEVCCKVWFNKFVDEFKQGSFDTGLIVLFSNSHLNILDFKSLYSNEYYTHIGVCTLTQRLKFEIVQDNLLIVKNQPTHHSSIVLVTKIINNTLQKFSNVFSIYGNVWKHYYSIYSN